MIRFDGIIVQFGFGAVGKSFYEKVSKEIKFDEKNYFVITKFKEEFQDYIYLGGLTSNFITSEITKENFQSIFKQYLKKGDLLIDFADTIGTVDICDWCAKENIMYINTGVADWPNKWLNIFEQDNKLTKIKEKYLNDDLFNKHPIVLQHGNNPGLVSHFVKAAIEYIVNTQYKRVKELKLLLSKNKFNELANILGIKMIHVNDIDLQKTNDTFNKNTLVNTWCIDTFFYEMITESTINIGSHEEIDFHNDLKSIDHNRGFLEFKNIAVDKKCATYYPNGRFTGYLVPHEETITIAKSLEIRKNDQLIYRPTVLFLYKPCAIANEYLEKSKVNNYLNPNLNKPLDCEHNNQESIIRGHIYPKQSKIIYKEHLKSGTEYVGVLLIGENFNPVWVGNRVKPTYLYKKQANSHWQTPTITPVAMAALAAVCWMIKNKDKGGFYYPDDIEDYKYILKKAEKYISKTIYTTFAPETVEKELKIDLNNLQVKDLFVN